MKSYFSRFLHHTLSHSGIREVFTSSLSLSDLIGESRSNKVANLSHLDYRVKPDNDSEGVDYLVKPECDTLGKSASTGRSMVEMLGVLAIIGVLSVGAIAGYSKAMMKYKLNKQTEQIGSILDYVNMHFDDLKRSKTDTVGNLIPLFKKLGVIPQEMIRKNRNDAIFDVFGTTIVLANYFDDNYTFEFLTYLNKGQKESCMNLFTIAKAKKEQLYRTKFETYKGEENASPHMIYGDGRCRAGLKCLKDLTIAEMEDFCNVCEDKDTCVFYYQIHL